MERRGVLKGVLAAIAGVWAGERVTGDTAVQAAAQAGVAQTKHVRLYVEMDIAPGREREMLDTFHNQFVPEAVKHEGYIRVKMLKRRTVIQGSVPPSHNYRFELEFEPAPKSVPRVGVQFEIDANGILHVLARDVRTGHQMIVPMKSAVDVADEDVQRMVEESVANAFDDMKARQWIEAKVRAGETILGAFETASLIAVAVIALGLFAVLVTPREEEPQINVTMANVLVHFPGASSNDVQNMVGIPVPGLEDAMTAKPASRLEARSTSGDPKAAKADS